MGEVFEMQKQVRQKEAEFAKKIALYEQQIEILQIQLKEA